MTKVESIVDGVRRLTRRELEDFRRRFEEYDAEAWDRQIEDDVGAGKLDDLAERALRAHAAGESTRL